MLAKSASSSHSRYTNKVEDRPPKFSDPVTQGSHSFNGRDHCAQQPKRKLHLFKPCDILTCSKCSGSKHMCLQMKEWHQTPWSLASIKFKTTFSLTCPWFWCSRLVCLRSFWAPLSCPELLASSHSLQSVCSLVCVERDWADSFRNKLCVSLFLSMTLLKVLS